MSENEFGLTPGLEARYEKIVPQEWTIAYYDPSLPSLFSTPALIGMMECAAARAVQASLPPGTLTVGTRIEVDHLKAAPAGSLVIASARLTEVNGRFLSFDVEAHVGETLIGRGRVFRAVVEHARFERKAIAKRATFH